MSVNPVPEEHQSVIPYPIIRGVTALVDFLKAAFDAEEIHQIKDSDGSVMHAQVKVLGSSVMMGEAGTSFQPMPGSIYLYVDDVDAYYRRALDAGAESVMEPADQFYGDRSGGIKDPAGNIWWISSRIEQISTEELQERAAARDRR